MKKAKPYVFSILLALTVGGLSALATANNMNIYDKITMPPLSPPGWLFPVVWTILFILMGISGTYFCERFSAKGRCSFRLCRQPCTQFYVEYLVFQYAGVYSFVYCACWALGVDYHHHRQIFYNRQKGGMVADALPYLGNLCRVSKRRHCDFELV